MRNLAYKFINIYNQPMIDLKERQIHKYENAKYCHTCKKVFGDEKSIKKYVIMIITQVNLGVPHIQYAI